MKRIIKGKQKRSQAKKARLAKLAEREAEAESDNMIIDTKESDNPSIEDDEWEAALKKHHERRRQNGDLGVKQALNNYRFMLYHRLCGTVLTEERLTTHTLQVAMKDDADAEEVEQSAFFERINMRTATLHAYIMGVTKWTNGTEFQRRMHGATDWSKCPDMKPNPLTCKEAINLWQEYLAITFAAAIIPLFDPIRRGMVLFIFEWYDPSNHKNLATKGGASTGSVAVGILFRLAPEVLEECMKFFEETEVEGGEKDEETSKSKSTSSANGKDRNNKTICEVLPRLWLVTPNDPKARQVGTLKTMEFGSTGCSFEASEGFREKSRLLYQTTCLVDADLASLQTRK
jgi:hypothetical protein